MAVNQTSKLRVMVDANVLVAAIGWPRYPYEVLQHGLRDDFQLVLSPYIVDEAGAHVARLFSSYLDRFNALIKPGVYEEVQTPTVEEIEANADLVRDPKDIAVALAAINAHVDYLVTQDKDFTDRGADTEELHRRLNIILPGTFLREHMGWTSEALEAIRRRTWQDLEG
jgi:putative PIN family toxin of toxin-antitoxin system